MDKAILPGGWSWDEPVISPVKVSGRGLVGSDLKELIKRAGHQFADRVRRMDFAPGDVPIHLLALGATEYYGPNRNGDGFKVAMLTQYHPTFVKHARYYYNHANKDRLKSYGFVQDSSYHPTMHRVELLVCLNGTKQAASRNQGFVAERDLQDLAAGRDIPVSMAIKVPYDICSGCGNRARSRDEYCTELTCKYGGLRDNITKVAADGHILHADNTEGVFFDISRVFRPADRIAYVFGRIKAAADGNGIGGAALAELLGVSTPDHVFVDHEHPGVKLAHALAACEGLVDRDGIDRWGLAFAPEVQPPTTWHDHGAHTFLPALTALAGEKVAMPLQGFLEMACCGKPDAPTAFEAVANRLPGVYTRMVRDGSIFKTAAANPFVPPRELPPLRVREWARKKAADYSLDVARAERRIKIAAVRRRGRLTELRPASTIKVAGDVEGLARAYALYKLGMLQALEGSPGFQLTASLAVLQNYSIDGNTHVGV